MPIYEYECKTCGGKFEALVYSESEKIICVSCGSMDSKRLMSEFAAGGSTSSSSNSCGGAGAFT